MAWNAFLQFPLRFLPASFPFLFLPSQSRRSLILRAARKTRVSPATAYTTGTARKSRTTLAFEFLCGRDTLPPLPRGTTATATARSPGTFSTPPPIPPPPPERRAASQLPSDLLQWLARFSLQAHWTSTNSPLPVSICPVLYSPGSLFSFSRGVEVGQTRGLSWIHSPC